MDNKSIWAAIDKDQLGYETKFNRSGEFHDGPRTADNEKTFLAHEIGEEQDNSEKS